MKKLTQAAMIKKLNSTFPTINAVPASEFYGRPVNGIWLRGTEEGNIDGQEIFNDYGHQDTCGVHPKLDALVTQSGWFCEPYDSGTLMVHEN